MIEILDVSQQVILIADAIELFGARDPEDAIDPSATAVAISAAHATGLQGPLPPRWRYPAADAAELAQQIVVAHLTAQTAADAAAYTLRLYRRPEDV